MASRKKMTQERGAARIQQLMGQFPEISRERILLADTQREGTKHTPILEDVGRWVLPDTLDHYDYGYEEVGKEEGVATGYKFTPKFLWGWPPPASW